MFWNYQLVMVNTWTSLEIPLIYCKVELKLKWVKHFVSASAGTKTAEGVIKNTNVKTNGNNFYEKPMDSDIKRCKEIRELTACNVGDYTAGCSLDYEYIRDHYRLTAVDLSWQKELDAYQKANQKIELVGWIKD